MIHFNNVAIIGVGLIGGSLARVMRKGRFAGTITGAGRSKATLEEAIRLGVIDRIANDLGDAVDNADLVVIATPVATFEAIVREAGPRMKPGAIVTDVGSVKGGLVKALEKLLPSTVHYVPGHPIAGKETSGVAESTDALFQGARWIITPTERTDPAALAAVEALCLAAGAQVQRMDADLHDRVFGAVSHLPHVAAYAMVCAVAEMNTGSEDYISFSGGGFRDFTRIAASSPEMWRDICLLNRKNVIEMIERYQFSLNMMKRAIRAKDRGKLEELFRSASNVRKGMK